MRRLQEVELRVSLLPLCQPLKELLAVSRHELSCQLYHIGVNIREDCWMTDNELILGVGP